MNSKIKGEGPVGGGFVKGKPQKTQEYFLQFGQKRLPIINRQTLIGRNPNSGIFVDDHSIAKDHAIIELDENMLNPKLV